MKKSNVILLLFFFVIVVPLLYLSITNELGRETKIVEGVVIDYEVVYENNFLGGEKPFLILTFDNNETYKFSFPDRYDEYDFTVSSKLILHITKGGQAIAWNINQIIKVPVLEEEIG